MKLSKFVRYIDAMINIELYENDNVVWSGGNYLLQAALNNTPEQKADFIRSCKEDGDYDTINSFFAAVKFQDYVIDTNVEDEPLLLYAKINEYGAKLVTATLCIKKKEKKNGKRR